MVEQLAKIPPHNTEAEQSLLGCVLIDRDAMIKVADIVTAEDFYSAKHMTIFQTMVDLYNTREAIDVLTVANKLDEKNKLEEIGGRGYLVSLSNTVPTSSHISQYAKIVAKKATLRNLIQAATKINSIGYAEDQDVETILDTAEQELFHVSQGRFKQAFTPINAVLNETFDRIDRLHKEKGKIRGIPTGFRELDRVLAGLQNSDLIILAARPGVGKTSLALDLARHVAVNEKKVVGIFSLEMSRDQLVDRILCSEANIPLWKLRTGQLSDNPSDDDFPKLGHAMGTLAEAKLFIDDLGSASIMDVRTKARRLQMEHGLDFLIVDYLQLMEARTASESRTQEISEISRGLKQIAKELNVPVLALSQLNRSVEMRNPPIPKLADLRESGSIEQDADIVIFIYREAMYNKTLELDKRGVAELHIAKHRNGPTDNVKVFFDETMASYRNLDTSHYLQNTPPAADSALPNFG